VRIFIWGIALTVLSSFSTHPADTGTGTLVVTFYPRMAGQPLVLGSQLYPTPQGDSLYLDLLRIYISSIQLEGPGNIFKEKDSYHLLDASDPGTLRLEVKNVPVGHYNTLRFNIGTDSLANVSGAMGGDLDPTLGMYWAWNSGFINFKLEGRSSACPTLHNAFEFHIGGYKAPYQTLRQFVRPVKMLGVSENANTLVSIGVDLDKFFKRIQLKTTNQVNTPSAKAAQMADYFKDVFILE
jgi:hypothetical protein